MGKYDYLITNKAPITTQTTAGKYSYLIPQATPPIPKSQPTPRKGILGGLQEVVKDVTEVVRSPFPKQSFNPKVAFDVATEGVAETLMDAFNRYKKSLKAYSDPKIPLKEKAVAQAELSMGLVNVALSPITSSLKGAAHLPVVGSVAESFNRFFGVLGTLGSDVGEGAIESLPISDKTKKLITPLAQEVTALVAQVAGGKASLDKISALRKKSEEIAKHIDEDATFQVKVISDNSTTQIPVKTPKIRHEEYAKKMGYEPFTPLEQLPVIKMGSKPKSDIPTIQIGAPRSKSLGDLTIEPIKSPFSPKEMGTIETVSSKPNIKRVGFKPTSVEGAKQVANTRAQTLEKAAVEKKLTESLGDLPTHSRINMADQVNRALTFIEKSPDRALKVIRGEAVPDGILPETLYTAMEIKAIKSGDVAMLKELSRSTIPTTAGQAMKALDSVDPNSPVKIMRDIQQIRETRVESKTGKKNTESVKDTVQEIKKEVEKSVSKRQNWDEFIRSIECR